MRRVYVRPVVQKPVKPTWEHRERDGQIPSGWQVHHIDYNHANNDSDNVVALPYHVHHFLHRRRLRPSLAACRAIVAWWRATHPTRRTRTFRHRVVAIVRDHRRRESAVGRADRVAAYVAGKLQQP